MAANSSHNTTECNSVKQSLQTGLKQTVLKESIQSYEYKLSVLMQNSRLHMDKKLV